MFLEKSRLNETLYFKGCTSAILYPSSRLPFVLSRLSAERLTGANIDFVLRDLQAEEGEAEERRRAVGLMAENAGE